MLETVTFPPDVVPPDLPPDVPPEVVVVDPHPDGSLQFCPDLKSMQPGGIATFGPGTGQTGVPTLLHLVELVA